VLEKFLDEMLDWKREIGEKDQEQWGSCVAESNVSLKSTM
jgi:hypothetical protein